MNLPHRRPFGEGNDPSETEAQLAGKSFHVMMNDLFRDIPETRKTVKGFRVDCALDLVINEGYPGIKASLYRQNFLEDGGYIERINLHELGETNDTWGPKICQYVHYDGDQPVLRYDAPSAEAKKMANSIEIEGDKVIDELKTVFEALKLESSLELNNTPVGVEEINDLRDLLSTGTPIPYKELDV